MRTLRNYLWVFLASLLSISCSEDDELPEPGSGNPPPGEDLSVYVDFDSDFSMLENEGAKEVKLLFDKPAIQQGVIRLRLHVQNGAAFSSIPAAVDGFISLDIEEGDELVSFQIIPVDDQLIKGDKVISITFSSLSEGFTKADNNGMVISIKDDDLIGKPKSFSGNGLYIEYTYLEDGKIASVRTDHWAAPVSTEVYHYSEDGKVIRVENKNAYGDFNVHYHWESVKLISSEVIENEEKTAYTLYDYDPAGNIGGKSVYHKQVSGEFTESMLFIYLYFEDGNLYKQLTYIPVSEEGEEDYQLISTRSYEHYLDKDNLFPVNEVVPGIMTQRKLPSNYRVEENGFNLNYEFTYYYDEQERMIRRETDGETISYTYYN